MRFLIKVTIPTESGNKLFLSGRLAEVINTALGNIKPEVAYFSEINGERTGFIFADISDVSTIPYIAEPFFVAMNARVEFHPAMSGEDLAKGLPAAIESVRAVMPREEVSMN